MDVAAYKALLEQHPADPSTIDMNAREGSNPSEIEYVWGRVKRILRKNNTGTSTGAVIFPKTMEPMIHIGQDEAAYKAHHLPYKAYLEQHLPEPSTIHTNASNSFATCEETVIVFSSGHGKFKDGDLNTMNGAFGGKQHVS